MRFDVTELEREIQEEFDAQEEDDSSNEEVIEEKVHEEAIKEVVYEAVKDTIECGEGREEEAQDNVYVDGSESYMGEGEDSEEAYCKLREAIKRVNNIMYEAEEGPDIVKESKAVLLDEDYQLPLEGSLHRDTFISLL